MISDLVTGQFMNGPAQYGIRPAIMLAPIIIPDPNPPQFITYTDSIGNLVDEITEIGKLDQCGTSTATSAEPGPTPWQWRSRVPQLRGH